MKVFASRFLETPVADTILTPDKWNWKPLGGQVQRIYASGASTSTRSSTYAAEKDNRSDSDRPNEGSLAA